MRKISMDNKDISFDIYQPFGPSILKTKLPQVYVDALNEQSDTILNDETPVSYTHLTLPTSDLV